MAYFECIIGGAGTTLTVTCDSAFAGKTITCTDGTTTLTAVCPSASPYVVEFDLETDGTWTISGTISGTTHSTSVTIETSATLHEIPNGSTITPVANIQTWLHCANIWDKNYTTISQVLADASTLQALIASNNAADYMARSTSWASSVCANANAMIYIGANDYCANILLANSTWMNAIVDSTYFASVLNKKVPTMTSNTTPSGVVSASSYTMAERMPYKAFDSNDSTVWRDNNNKPKWIEYQFPSAMKLYKMVFKGSDLTISYLENTAVELKASNDGATYTSLKTFNKNELSTENSANFSPTTSYSRFRIYIYCTYTTNDMGFAEIQFYGR